MAPAFGPPPDEGPVQSARRRPRDGYSKKRANHGRRPSHLSFLCTIEIYQTCNAEDSFQNQVEGRVTKAEEELSNYETAVKEAIADDDAAALAECRADLSPYEGKIVAARLSPEEHKRSMELRELSDD